MIAARMTSSQLWCSQAAIDSHILLGEVYQCGRVFFFNFRVCASDECENA